MKNGKKWEEKLPGVYDLRNMQTEQQNMNMLTIWQML